MASRIILGTAQFGLSYGIANMEGQITADEGARILAVARDAGMDTLDTAIAYGNSETAIGELGSAGWKIITKLPAVPDERLAAPCEWIDAQLHASCVRLNVSSLHGLLLHRPAQLLGPNGPELYRALCSARNRGLVSKIGISIYGPEELESLPSTMTFDIVQTPLNVLDQRMHDSGWAARLSAAGCEIHVRSIFLQGLLLMKEAERPARFARWNPVWRTWHRWLEDHHLSPLEACVRHALQAPHVAALVVGVDSSEHLRQIVEAVGGPLPPFATPLAAVDPVLLNPALWPKS